MRFIFWSGPTFDKWDWRNPVTKGIGGSETHHIELSRRLAARGHEVISYAPVPFSKPKVHAGVTWIPVKNADYRKSGTWIVARDPVILDKFIKKRKNKQRIWFVAQDSFYTTWTKKRIKTCDRIFALCEEQRAALLSKHPEMAGKITVSSNGIPGAEIEEMRPFGPVNKQRNVKRLIYTSSPDRGLKQLLQIFKRVREYVPDAELHAYYGWNNINRIIKANPGVTGFRTNKEEVVALLKQPGVYWHGRQPQPKLWREWLKSGIWAYPANFTETSAISCMEAQALGAIPICNHIWAVGENVKHGVFIYGDVDEPITRARYAAEIVRLMTQPHIQNVIRTQMMPWARRYYDWERVADQLEFLALYKSWAPTRAYPIWVWADSYRRKESYHLWARGYGDEKNLQPMMSLRLAPDGTPTVVSENK